MEVFMLALTKDNFDAEVKNSPAPVLVDFWADWCGPCKALAPILEEVANEFAGKLKVGKVNVDEQGELAQEHSVVSIPTLFLYKDGKIAQKSVGLVSKQVLIDFFKEYV
jgi:thioredoxin 1